jgi:UDP-glucose 4-epimerase
MQNNILITGGAGFIGGNLAKKLIEQKYDVTSIDNYSTGSKFNHVKGCKYIDYSITNKIENLNLSNISAVFHLAASARIQKSFQKPRTYFDNNVIGTMNVIEYCYSQQIPLIYAGSSSHHSGRLSNPYTCTKDMGEDLVNLYVKHFNFKSSITRFYNVYGPGESIDDNGTLVGKWKGCLRRGEKFIIYGDGSKRRDFTHVEDIVDALISIVDKNAFGHIFELGRGKNYSVIEVLEMFNQKDFIFEPDQKGEIDSTLCDYSLAKKLLNWEPKHNLEDYILDLQKRH